MVPLPELLAFLVAAIIIIVVPGPGVLFVIGRALAHGTRGALISVLGAACGGALQIIAVSAGLGVLVAQSELLFTALKIVGALVLVWLGIQSIRHRRAMPDADANANADLGMRPPTIGRLVRESFIVGITNPKTIVFFAAALPQFADPAAGSVVVQMLQLGGIFLAIGIVSDSVYGIVAGSARAWFATDPGRLSGLRASGGVALIGLGASMALASRS
ncbi:MAG: LysE family translocator [Salinibacterium sp.]|nr:LysE family translocator [Salinibacterium sp.]